MLLRRRLRLTSPLLSAKRPAKVGERRTFNRLEKTPQGEDPQRIYILAQAPRWIWAFLEARDALSLNDVAVSAIIPGQWYSVKRTTTYNRNFRKGMNGAPQQEKFEAVASNCVVEMDFILSKHIPPGTDGGGRFDRPPSEEEFDDMLAYIGEHLGISEWGHGYHYGLFEVRPPLDAQEEPAPKVTSVKEE